MAVQLAGETALVRQATQKSLKNAGLRPLKSSMPKLSHVIAISSFDCFKSECICSMSEVQHSLCFDAKL